MLKHLSITNYALIEQLELTFEKGLSIITGETGAGKSILLGALRLVLGERADIKAIKNIEKKCVVEASFSLAKLNLQSFFEENELDYEDETIIRREILPSGKSRAFVNDVPTTLKIVTTLSNYLIDIHSQFQTSNLVTEEFQFEWLDSVANNQELLAHYREELKEYNNKKSLLRQKEKQKEELEKEADYNLFLFEELEEASLDQLNIEELEQEQYLLENAEEIAIKLSASNQILEEENSGLLFLLSELKQNLKSVSSFIKEGESLKERVESARIELQDISNEIQEYLEETEVNPDRLIEVQNLFNLVNTLLQKHKVSTIDELIDIRESLNQKLLDETQADEQINKLKEDIEIIRQSLAVKSNRLHKQRLEVVPQIKKEVISTLSLLGMENSIMDIQLASLKDFNEYGLEKIQILFSANKGIEPKAIENSVSGGERSRLMLAIKKSLAHYKSLPTLILDEIDTGVSGKIAGAMGDIMKQMSKEMQLMAITHLPQVASKGDTHLKVQKRQLEETSITEVNKLTQEQRVEEIAQMLSGSDITKAAKEQARQLLKNV